MDDSRYDHFPSATCFAMSLTIAYQLYSDWDFKRSTTTCFCLYLRQKAFQCHESVLRKSAF